MKYCSQCGTEYQDGVQQCSDCGNFELLSAAEMEARGLPMEEPETDQTHRFERAGTVDDPLTAEQVAGYLREKRIAVFVRQRMGGTVDRLTDGTPPYWEILVPEDRLEEANHLIEKAKAELSSTEEEAARAAEEEELELEHAGAKPA